MEQLSWSLLELVMGSIYFNSLFFHIYVHKKGSVLVEWLHQSLILQISSFFARPLTS